MIKRVLAVIVALSIFLCSSVFAFAAEISVKDFSFPYFTHIVSYGRNSDGSTFQLFDYYVSGSQKPVVFSDVGDPISSYVFPNSFSSSFISIFLGGSDIKYTVGSSTYTSHTWSGFSPGDYRGSFVFSSSTPVTVSPPVVVASSLVSSPGGMVDYVTSSETILSSNNLSGVVYFNYSIPPSFISDSDSVYFTFSFPSQVSFTSFSFSPTSYAVPDFPSIPNEYSPGVSSSYVYTGHTYLPNDALNVYDLSRHAYVIQASIREAYYGLGDVISGNASYFPLIYDRMASMMSLIHSLNSSQSDDMRNSVPDGLPDQQQEAQQQLNDYENKEQQVFDNLNTSLDDLNLNQYQQFDTSIVSAMTFVNCYVTAGFDGLVNFKIILFLPMVIGIGLSVIGRMGAMMSRVSVRSSMTSSQIRRNTRNYTSNGRTTRRR